MKSLAGSASTALIWLAATMTVVAGGPHAICRCPNGNVKFFCFGCAGSGRSCCCAGVCCAGGNRGPAASEPASQVSSHRCPACPNCQEREPGSDPSPKSGPTLDDACCVRSVQGGDVLALAPRISETDDLAASSVLASPLDSRVFLSLLPKLHSGLPKPPPGPPPDLVIAHQHFVI